MNSVYATYEDISDCWPIFKHNIEGFFPLRNIHKSKTTVPSDVNTLIRNIPVINLKFVPLKAELLADKSLLNQNERPYLHIFIGFCDDIDMYRQHFRPKLKSWLEALSIRKTHQYIVILIEDQTAINDSSKSNKTFLLDKIRFDFSDKVSLKLISLKLLPGEILSTVPECINLISDSVYNSAIMNLNQLDEEIRKLASQQNIPGWNFFTFFLTKESKALALSDLGLFSEALACYDELETLFLDINASDYSSKFESLMPSEFNIRGLDLNSTNWAKFRESIHQNRISLYEFRVYLLSRQIHILKEVKDQAQILFRCKEFVCQSMFIEKVDQNAKSEWIFDVIFFILKLIDFDSIQAENRQDSYNILAEILLLAEAQINFDLRDMNGINIAENLLDLSQLISLPYPLEIDKKSYFKLSALRYCSKILKNTPFTYKQLMVSLKLSDLYYEMKMYEIALEVLQEPSEQVFAKNWSMVQLALMEKMCLCYWDLNMRREYLRKFFEITLINGSQKFKDEKQLDRINEAALLLDDVLTFDFDNFFSVKDISTDPSIDPQCFNIIILSNFLLPFKEYQVELTLSGENEDVMFNSEVTPTSFEENIIKTKLSCKNEYSEGTHKIKSISIKFGKVEFKSENGSDIWKNDIELLAASYLHVEAIIPKIFNFSDPCVIIRCQNISSFDIENLTLEIVSSDLDLYLYPETDQNIIASNGTKCVFPGKLAHKSYFDSRFNINKYKHGRHFLRVMCTHKRDENINLKTNHFIEIAMPKLWDMKRSDSNYKDRNFYCLEISPNFRSKNIKILTLGTDDDNLSKSIDFNFEIDGLSPILNVSGQSYDEFKTLSVTYVQNEEVHSIIMPVDKSKPDTIYCKCSPLIDSKDIKIGIPITFNVKVNEHEKLGNIIYSICYDHSHWLLSGPSSGYIKDTWCFEAIPISLGFLQQPTISLLTPLPTCIETVGSTIFVTV